MANKKLSALITIGGAVAGTLIGSLDKTKTKIDTVGSALKNLQAQQSTLGNAIQTFGAMGKNVDGMRVRYQALTAQVNQLRSANERLLQIEKMRTANQESQSQLRQKIGETAITGAAIALPSIALFSKSSQFNYDLKMIGLTANMSDEAIAAMSDQITSVSEKTGKSAEDVKNAIGFLVAAGQSTETISANIETIGRTATATGSQIEDVAKATFVMGDALKVNPAAMNDALGILVQSGKEGNFEFKAMAAELPTLAASFTSLKMSGTEAVATMGAALQIARKGAGSESEAANNFSNFLAKILSPDTLKKAEQMGSDLYGVISDAQDRGANPIEAAIEEINRITEGGDQKLLGEIFGDMQVQNFVRPMLQNMKQYQEIKEKALGAQGVVDKDFAEVLATSRLQIDMMNNSFSILGKTIGEVIEPAFAKVAVIITPVVRATREWVSNNKELVGGFLVVGGVLTTLRLAVLSTQLAYKMLGGGILNIAASLAKQRIAALAAATSTTAAGTAATFSFGAMAAGIRAVGIALMTTPIGALVGAIAVAGALVYKYWGGVSAFLGGVWKGIKIGLEPVVQVFSNLLDSLGPVGSGIRSVIGWFGDLLAPVQFTADGLANAEKAGESFGLAIGKIIDGALFAFNTLVELITFTANSLRAFTDESFNFTGTVGTSIGRVWGNVTSMFGDEDPNDAPHQAPGSIGVGLSAAIGKPRDTPTGPMIFTNTADQSLFVNQPEPAPLPPMATSKSGAGGITDNSQNHFTIYQQPGQDSKKLAEEIARQQEQRRSVMQRGTLYDGAVAS